MGKDLLSMYDVTAHEMGKILASAMKLKAGKKKINALDGKTLGLIFEKPSTRTTVSFAVAMYQLGGFPLILNAQNLQRKRGETLHDTALTLSRYVDGIMIRAFRHADVEELARWATVPVINGLTDQEHPCQVLGDILTIMEKKKLKTTAQLKHIKVVFVGDGNNVANSWIAAAAILGFTFVLACPKGYCSHSRVLQKAQELAEKTGGSITVSVKPHEAVKEADVIYTDVWTSMGAESEREKRIRAFAPYQVNGRLVAAAKKTCLVMHCLPAIRGEEITADVMDAPESVIFDQAENRLHIQKAILIHLMK